MQKVTKAERQIKADKVVDLILKYIKDNNLQAGSRLPSERVLVEMFSVGRPAIREATRILSILGIIEIRQQGGMFVADPERRSRLDYFRLYMQSGQISLTEVLETRLILEVECIALAAEHITDEQLDRIGKIISNVSIDDVEGFAEADSTLHSVIYASTGNRALQLLMQTISMWTVISRGFSNSFEEVRQIVHSDHRNIYHALRARDVEKCRESMRQHIQHLSQIHHISDVVMKEELAKLFQPGEGENG